MTSLKVPVLRIKELVADQRHEEANALADKYITDLTSMITKPGHADVQIAMFLAHLKQLNCWKQVIPVAKNLITNQKVSKEINRAAVVTIAMFDFENNNYESALTHAKKALELVEKNKLLAELSVVTLKLVAAFSLLFTNNHADAMTHFESAAKEPCCDASDKVTLLQILKKHDVEKKFPTETDEIRKLFNLQ